VSHPEWGDIENGVIDERFFWSYQAVEDHPVTLDDYADSTRYQLVERFRYRIEDGERPLLIEGGVLGNAVVFDGAVRPDLDADGVLTARAVGIAGYAAGPDIVVIDPVGLGDVIASHIHRNGSRVGHIKKLPEEWIAVRAGDPTTIEPPVDPVQARAVVQAMNCGGLADLLDATTEPLTPGRFFANILGAPANTSLRYSDDPVQAARELCG